ncbi:MAG: hypothetical protein DWQ37_16345 [Planctomycetota bacterium]|nr:MAG: hypothetical protein DWQ37_16345 [Planctomycetota bacterium]
MIRTLLCSVVYVLSTAALASAENWPHWRGESGNGSSSTAHPPTEWSATKNVKWKVPIPGRGTGSPVIWGDRVFVVTATPVEGEKAELQADGQALPNLQFELLCFDRGTGELRWKNVCTTARPHQGTHPTHGFASASPCTDGERVYAHFGSRGLYCFAMDGAPRWSRDDFGQMETLNGFGEGSSPTLEGGKILVPWDHQGQSYLYALDKETGETIWRVERDEPSCWATPLVVTQGGRKQIIMNGQNYARAYDLETGEELWRCAGQTTRPVASPVATDDRVYVGSGFRGAFLGAFRLDGRGNIQGTPSVDWVIDRDAPDIASPLLSSGRIYFHKGKTALLSCVDAATGKPHYMAKRIPNLRSTYASPIAAGGHVYLTGRSGTTVVIKDADAFGIVASNSLGEGVDATPAPVDNELFIRGENHLFCIAE